MPSSPEPTSVSHERATAAGAVSVSSAGLSATGAASAVPGTAAMTPASAAGRNKVLRIKNCLPRGLPGGTNAPLRGDLRFGKQLYAVKPTGQLTPVPPRPQ